MVVKKFADDTKLGKVVESARDCEEFQICLDKMVQWSDKWGMSFNISKCKVMHLGRKNGEYQYTMGGQRLSKTESERDIGVTANNNAKPSAQCAKAVKSASVVLGQIARAFSYRDKKNFLRLYMQYVRPHLEFAVQAWSPWLVKDVEVLEKVLKKSVNMIGGLQGHTYEEKLKEIGLMSLVDRRREADLMLAYKVLNGHTKVDQETWFKRTAQGTAIHNTRAEADSSRLVKPRSKIETRSNFYFQRMVDEWNALPESIRMSKTVGSFKQALRKSLEQPS